MPIVALAHCTVKATNWRMKQGKNRRRLPCETGAHLVAIGVKAARRESPNLRILCLACDGSTELPERKARQGLIRGWRQQNRYVESSEVRDLKKSGRAARKQSENGEMEALALKVGTRLLGVSEVLPSVGQS